ncbi:MAG: hypothetical protein HZA94_02705 [Candidatus Vogelbacteria bacterium]|nr:hypothetical protein [Candidatus Vogelbacteria bacterium]
MGTAGDKSSFCVGTIITAAQGLLNPNIELTSEQSVQVAGLIRAASALLTRCATVPIAVVAPPSFADLIIQDVTVSPSFNVNGGVITAQIKNNGVVNAPASVASFEFWATGNSVNGITKARNIPVLAPGQVTIVEVGYDNLGVRPAAGYNLKVLLDINNAVNEGTAGGETNNYNNIYGPTSSIWPAVVPVAPTAVIPTRALPVSNFTAVRQVNGSILLSWVRPETLPASSSYTVYRRTTNVLGEYLYPSVGIGSAQTSYTDNGVDMGSLDSGVIYYYWIFVINFNDQSKNSVPVTASVSPVSTSILSLSLTPPSAGTIFSNALSTMNRIGVTRTGGSGPLVVDYWAVKAGGSVPGPNQATLTDSVLNFGTAMMEAGSYTLYVKIPGTNVQATLPFTVAAPAITSPVTVTSASPSSGPAGTVITLIGTGFYAANDPGYNDFLNFLAGDVNIPAYKVPTSDTQIQFTVPASLPAGTYDLRLNTVKGGATPLTQKFIVTAPTPAEGTPAPDPAVTVTADPANSSNYRISWNYTPPVEKAVVYYQMIRRATNDKPQPGTFSNCAGSSAHDTFINESWVLNCAGTIARNEKTGKAISLPKTLFGSNQYVWVRAAISPSGFDSEVSYSIWSDGRVATEDGTTVTTPASTRLYPENDTDSPTPSTSGNCSGRISWWWNETTGGNFANGDRGILCYNGSFYSPGRSWGGQAYPVDSCVQKGSFYSKIESGSTEGTWITGSKATDSTCSPTSLNPLEKSRMASVLFSIEAILRSMKAGFGR